MGNYESVDAERKQFTRAIYVTLLKNVMFWGFFVIIGYKLSNKTPPCHGNPQDFIRRNVLIIATFKPPDT